MAIIGLQKGSGKRSRVREKSVKSQLFDMDNEWQPCPREGGTKVCINGPGHMTKMAATPIYGKNPSKIFFSRTDGPISTKLSM